MAVGALAFCQAGWSLQWCPASAVLSALRFLVVFEGAVRHPPSVPVRSLFRRFLHAVPLRLGPAGGRPGWLRPGRALAALVLAAGLWLRGPGESS